MILINNNVKDKPFVGDIVFAWDSLGVYRH